MNDFLRGKRILIAEDDFVNQKLISHSLQATGAGFDIASNGSEVIEMLQKDKYDLILMDINMPEMDGFETAEYIRNTLRLDTPIISMSGWSSKEDFKRFEKVGMNGNLPKPFGLDALYGILNDILINSKSQIPAPTPIVVQEIPNSTQSENHPPMKIDLTLLNELSESDAEYKRTIIDMFLESMPETIEKIETAFDQQDWDTLSKSAHYAKSSLSVINVEELRLLMAKIEQSAKKLENLDQLGPLVVLVKIKYKQVEEFLLEELKK